MSKLMVEALSEGAVRKLCSCKRCELYGNIGNHTGCFHKRDVVRVVVSAPGHFKLMDMLPVDQLGALAQWTNKREKELAKLRRIGRRHG